MTEELKRFTLRINSEIFKELEKRAKENRRSITKEIENIIAAALNNKAD